jgi:RimJ/RimL family protein N-acetyltransferase
MLDCLTAGPLESQRLVLEPLGLEHAEELAPVLDDVALHVFVGGQPVDVEELRARCERQARGRSPDGRQRWLNWVVRERRAGRSVGTVQATLMEEQRTVVAELAWVIGSSHQGQGFAKEAAGVTAAWLRAQGVQCLRAHIHPRHHASMAVARSAGLAPTTVIVEGEVRWASS